LNIQQSGSCRAPWLPVYTKGTGAQTLPIADHSATVEQIEKNTMNNKQFRQTKPKLTYFSFCFPQVSKKKEEENSNQGKNMDQCGFLLEKTQ
jgi:hypothetical protein